MNKDNTTLLPCPFCGSKDVAYIEIPNADKTEKYGQIINGCNCQRSFKMRTEPPIGGIVTPEMVRNDVSRRWNSRTQAQGNVDEIIVSKKKYDSLISFYDKHCGTPCEQIRHAQEVQDLKDVINVAHTELYFDNDDHKRDYILDIMDRVLKGHKPYFKPELTTPQPPAPQSVVRQDEREAFEALQQAEDECWDIRCVTTGEDSYEWQIVGHWMAKPCDRIIGQGATIMAALKDAQQPRDYDGDLLEDGARAALRLPEGVSEDDA